MSSGSEWLRAQGHVWAFSRISRAFSPEPFDEGIALTVIERFLARHPMQRATREQVATCQAGRFVAYEGVGLSAGSAEIIPWPGPWVRGTWAGNAQSKAPLDYNKPGELDAATLRNEAVAVFAGPIAGELLARRDASNSIGELHSASVLARRAAELEGCAPSELLRNVVLEATALVEREDAMIRIVAGVLKSRKHISNDRPSLIPKVLSNVGREPIKTALLSPRGHAHFDKIMGALEHLWFLCGEMAL